MTLPALIPQVCRQCGGDYLATRAEFVKGRRAFCSRGCFHRSRTLDLTADWVRERAVIVPSGCWEWPSRTNKGYGTVCRSGTGRRAVVAHRISWAAFHGPIPAGLLVLHKCDNPPCVNPDHLFLGTHKDNTQDALRKGRLRLGRRRVAA